MICNQVWLSYTITMKETYKLFFWNKRLIISTCISLVFLWFSMFVNSQAGQYADNSSSNSVTDIVLSNIRAYDVDWFFVWGIVAFFLFIAWWCVRYPAQAPYIIKSIATFILIRSMFISLTHIWPFPTHAIIDSTDRIGQIISKVNFGADLFFSGHTWLPFLMALIFWDHKIIRYLFIATSIFFGMIVLLWHLHYSIDVMSAFFITYSIYRICEWLRASDKNHFISHHSIIYPQRKHWWI